MNPTVDVLEQRVAALEGGIAGLCTSAGSAAINYAILNLAEAGDNIVSTPQLYGAPIRFLHICYQSRALKYVWQLLIAPAIWPN